MGTRHLIGVVLNGALKVAQYGQWDGYPQGQGSTAYAFCKGLLAPGALESFRVKVHALREITQAECDALNGTDWKATHPHLSRDAGADVLAMVADGKVASLRLQADFVDDSLFCEWAYVVDLDTERLEVFKGFQKKRHDLGRFAKPEPNQGGYYPVALVASWPFAELPASQKDFVSACEPASEDEDES